MSFWDTKPISVEEAFSEITTKSEIAKLEAKIDDIQIEVYEVNRQLEIILRLMHYDDYKQYTRKP